MNGLHVQTRAKLCEGIALFLAFAGLFWGMVCLLAILAYPQSGLLLIFGPGYIVTAGYIARFFWVRSRPGRRLIWFASMLVQGVWLGWAIVESSGQGFLVASLFSLWWIIAFTVSVVAFLSEPKCLAPEPWWAR